MTLQAVYQEEAPAVHYEGVMPAEPRPWLERLPVFCQPRATGADHLHNCQEGLFGLGPTPACSPPHPPTRLELNYTEA